MLPALIRRFHEAKVAGLDEVTCWGDGSPLREFLYVDDLANLCVFLMNNYKGARADYEHLLRLQPTREEALLGLALLNEEDNRPREAMEQVNNIIQLYPNHATNYVVRGGMEQERKQYEAAIYDFDKAIQLEPENPEHYLSRANCYLAMKRRKLARRDIEHARSLGADTKVVAQLMAGLK